VAVPIGQIFGCPDFQFSPDFQMSPDFQLGRASPYGQCVLVAEVVLHVNDFHFGLQIFDKYLKQIDRNIYKDR
jgi:hypothetical protein